VRLYRRSTSSLPHGQKTCSAPNRLGCHRNILDDLNRWESTDKRLIRRISLDPTKPNRQGATEYNHPNSRLHNKRRYIHQSYSKHAYHNIIIVIVTLIAHPTRTTNKSRITVQTSFHRVTRLPNNSNYRIYKIYYPRSCKHSSKSRHHTCHNTRVRCSRSIPRPLHN
jgi:hypothetical protein